MADATTLDPEHLIHAARQATGLEDLEDDRLIERLALLRDQVESRVVGDALVRAAKVATDLLVERLRFFDNRNQYPIADEQIERPIIVFGEARTGTTMLQMLLACDPGARLLEFWELMRPTPPPGVSDTGERQRLSDDDWRATLKQIPKWIVSHPYNAMLGHNPPECERTWSFDFRAMNTSTWWSVPIPSYEISLPQDLDRQYAIHKMMLQHLQFRQPTQRWVLKGILHQHRLRALLPAYPDAIFVWIHRDPIEATASRFELLAQIYEGMLGSLDRPAFARANRELCVGNFARAAVDPLADDPRIHHLRYRDVLADPVATIQEIYQREGLPFTSEFAAGMKRWFEENPANRYGRFTYSIEEALGDDLTEIEAAVAPYRERFGLALETQRA